MADRDEADRLKSVGSATGAKGRNGREVAQSSRSNGAKSPCGPVCNSLDPAHAPIPDVRETGCRSFIARRQKAIRRSRRPENKLDPTANSVAAVARSGMSKGPPMRLPGHRNTGSPLQSGGTPPRNGSSISPR